MDKPIDEPATEIEKAELLALVQLAGPTYTLILRRILFELDVLKGAADGD